MASDDDHREAYEAVLAELAKLSEAWRIYREVINRAVSMLNHEVIGFKDRLDNDDKAREKRQAILDEKLAQIQAGQDSIKRWQWIRLGLELLAIAIAIAFFTGKFI